MTLAQETYMLLTTYRRDGRAVATPVWCAPLASGEIGFFTGADSGKVKRLKRTPRITVQACDARGESTHGPELTGSARLVRGTELAEIQRAIRTKYGIKAPITSFVMGIVIRVKSRKLTNETVGVVVDLDGAST